MSRPVRRGLREKASNGPRPQPTRHNKFHGISFRALRVAAWPRTVDAHRVVHRYGVAPRPQGGLPVGCPLPLEGAGLVVGFAGRPTVPSRPVELHPRCKLLITPIFQYFSGVEIDLHGLPFLRASRASQGVKNFNGLLPRGFSEGCVLQRGTCGSWPVLPRQDACPWRE